MYRENLSVKDNNVDEGVMNCGRRWHELWTRAMAM